MLDLSDGLAVDARTSRALGVPLVIELERVPLAPGATLDDLGFGEDYELLAATPDAARLHRDRPRARRARASS
jgi:thiamine monophosphate kinase